MQTIRKIDRWKNRQLENSDNWKDRQLVRDKTIWNADKSITNEPELNFVEYHITLVRFHTNFVEENCCQYK